MEEKLRAFLQQYIGQGALKKDLVQEDDVEMLVYSACSDELAVAADIRAEEIIDYGIAHPEAPFWDLLKLLKPGLYGVTQEELLADDDEDG